MFNFFLDKFCLFSYLLSKIFWETNGKFSNFIFLIFPPNLFISEIIIKICFFIFSTYFLFKDLLNFHKLFPWENSLIWFSEKESVNDLWQKKLKYQFFSRVLVEYLTRKSSTIFFEWNRKNDFDEKYTAWI